MNWANTTLDLSQRRVLVTGGAGFLGSVVVRKLRERGCENVFVPRSRDYDLVRGGDVERLMADAQPQIVIHLAARVGGIGANRDNPATFFYDNAMMGTQLMEQSRLAGVEKFVAIGTVCAYPKFAPVPFREEDLWNGYPEETNAPYGLAKRMSLVQAQAYRQQYGFNAIYLLPVNLYGPGDNFDPTTSHVIPALIKRFVEAIRAGEDRVVNWGDGSPTREFLYIDDAAEGIVLAAERYNGVEPVNLGTGQEISMRDLSQAIAAVVGYQGRILWDTSKPNGQPRRKLDTNRAREYFGFEARIDLTTGLRRAVFWYLASTQDSARTAVQQL
jgi:GDP-L-fucose synthase